MTVCELTDLLEQVDSSYIEEAAAPLKRNKKALGPGSLRQRWFQH